MAERYSRITLMMETFVVRLLQAAANISRVANLIKLDWHTVNDVIARAVERRPRETYPGAGAQCEIRL